MLHLVNNFWGNDSQCLGCLVSFSARVAVDMPMQPTDNIYTLFVLKQCNVNTLPGPDSNDIRSVSDFVVEKLSILL